MAKKIIFISYSRRDGAKARELVGNLQAYRREEYDVWIDQTSLRLDEEWWDGILKGIRTADVVVLVVSRSWLDAPACRAEGGYAREVLRPVLPLLAEPIPDAELRARMGTPQMAQITDLKTVIPAIDATEPRRLPDPLPAPPPAPINRDAVATAARTSDSLSEDVQRSCAHFLQELSGSATPNDRRWARRVASEFLERGDLVGETRADLEKVLGPNRAHVSLIVGVVLGAIAVTHLFWAVGLYEYLDSLIGEARGVIAFNFALAVIGSVLCLLAVRGRIRGARLGLSFCLVGILATILDAVKIGWVERILAVIW